jgi:hypothetical protein
MYNLQYSRVTRYYADSDFQNPETFGYEAVLGISPSLHFKDAPDLFICRSVANPALSRRIESYFELPPVLPTIETGQFNGTTASPTTITTTSPTPRPSIWDQPLLNETLVVQLLDASTTLRLDNATFQSPPEAGGAECQVFLVVKDFGGTNYPQWRCESANGSAVGAEDGISFNFAYCHEGMSCQNLFRTVKNQVKKSSMKEYQF